MKTRRWFPQLKVSFFSGLFKSIDITCIHLRLISRTGTQSNFQRQSDWWAHRPRPSMAEQQDKPKHVYQKHSNPCRYDKLVTWVSMTQPLVFLRVDRHIYVYIVAKCIGYPCMASKVRRLTNRYTCKASWCVYYAIWICVFRPLEDKEGYQDDPDIQEINRKKGWGPTGLGCVFNVGGMDGFGGNCTGSATWFSLLH